jgi:hypothetical protein
MRTFEIDGLKLTVGVDEFDRNCVKDLDNLDYHIAILECMKEGMKVEWYGDGDYGWNEWVDDSCNFSHHYYRIVPPTKESTYTAYTFDDCCSLGFLGKAVKRKSTGELGYVRDFDKKNIRLGLSDYYVDYTYAELMINFTWIDSSPCGMEL